MFIGEFSDAMVTDHPTFRINARNVIAEVKAVDSGVRAKLYFSHPALMYYFIRFCEIESRHHFIGNLNVTAYTFDHTSRAFASIRMSVDGVRPILQVSDDGHVIPAQAQRIRVRDFDRRQRFYKLKFMVYKYVWENIDEDFVTLSDGSSIDTFATEVSRMYTDLVTRGLAIGSYNPVAVDTAVNTLDADESNRPVPRTLRTVYEYNDNVTRITDWSEPYLSFQNLNLDQDPISPEAFIIPGEEAVRSPSAGERRRRTTEMED
ncbi:hypothetical protein A0J61_09688 [Choanephora cucurbitarum]|uniref:Uncharacterized protein n=1 Tax=Choanephora cucurbitarum TaxID=101091 RepID=A0A1C7MZQ8_9FUNG|nr:hypothetical protein A0J61_09688 [Choanephora cucurbitarum]